MEACYKCYFAIDTFHGNMFIENQTIVIDNLFVNGEHMIYEIRHMHVHI